MKVRREPLDDTYSEFIRKRAIKEKGGCERCLTPKFDTVKDNGDIFPAYKKLQCSHFIGRSNHSTRWDEDDCCGLCGACHIYFGHHPLEHVEFFTKRLGKLRFDLLQARARQIGRPDKNALTLYYKFKIKQLED